MEEKNVKKQERENGDGFHWNLDEYNSISSWKDRVDYCVGVQSLVPDQDREQARKWVWGKWMNYLNSVENGDLTWDDVYHYFSAFLNWAKVTSNELEWYREKKLQMKSQFRVAALHRLFNEHADMVENAKSDYMRNPSEYTEAYRMNENNLKRVYSIAGESRDGERVAAETKMRMTWEEVTITQRQKVSVPDPDEEYRSNGEGVLVLASITGMKVPEKKKETDLRSDYGDLPFCD